MTTSPAVRGLVLLGCVLATFEAHAQAAKTGPRSALIVPSVSLAPGERVRRPVRAAQDATIIACVHDITSMLTCPFAGDARLAGGIVSVTVTVRTRRDSATYTLDRKSFEKKLSDRKGVDAIFLSLSALDTFAMPYYIHKVSFDSAVAMRQRIKNGQKP